MVKTTGIHKLKSQTDTTSSNSDTTGSKRGAPFSERGSSGEGRFRLGIVEQEDANCWEYFRRRLVNWHTNLSKKDRSIFLFKPSHPLRNRARRIVRHPHFETAVLIAIGSNCILLALADPTLGEDSSWNVGLMYAEMFLLALFTIEAGLGILVNGFILCPNAYLLNPWNQLDLFVVLTAWMDFVMTRSGGGSMGFSALRALRSLRPLRSLDAVPGVKKLVITLFKSLPLLGDCFLLVLLLFLVFGLIGTQFFSGKLTGRCQVDVEKDVMLAFGPMLNNKFLSPMVSSNNSKALSQRICDPDGDGLGYHCEDPVYNGRCVDTGTSPQNGFFSFDHFGLSMLSIFQVITLSNWDYAMFSCVDGVGSESHDGAYLSILVFYFSVLVLGVYFTMQLLIAVLFSSFNSGMDTVEPTELILPAATNSPLMMRSASAKAMAEAMAGWLAKFKVVLQTSQPWRPYFLPIVESQVFVNVVLTVTLLNTVTMTLVHHGQSDTLTEVLYLSNTIFTIIFLAEMFLKLLAFGFVWYWMDTLNAIDGVVNIMSLLEMVAAGGSNMSALRMFRLVRIVRSTRLLRTWPKFMQMAKSIMHAFASLRDFSGLLGLFLFIFVVLGMQLFGGRDLNSEVVKRRNFDNFGRGFLTVFELLTGNDWDITAREYMGIYSELAGIYFIMIIVVGNYIVLNLFLAVLISNTNLNAEDNPNANHFLEGIEALTKSPIFSKCPSVFFQELTKFIAERKLFKGQKFAQLGCECEGLFILVSGLLRVSCPDGFIFTLNPGTIIGESALISKKVWTANIAVLETAIVNKVEKEDFDLLMFLYPDAFQHCAPLQEACKVSRRTRMGTFHTEVERMEKWLHDSGVGNVENIRHKLQHKPDAPLPLSTEEEDHMKRWEMKVEEVLVGGNEVVEDTELDVPGKVKLRDIPVVKMDVHENTKTPSLPTLPKMLLPGDTPKGEPMLLLESETVAPSEYHSKPYATSLVEKYQGPNSKEEHPSKQCQNESMPLVEAHSQLHLQKVSGEEQMRPLDSRLHLETGSEEEMRPLSSLLEDYRVPPYQRFRSMYLFTPENKFRQSCINLVSSQYFDSVIMVFIAVSSITLAIDSPTLEEDSTTKHVLNILDDLFFIVFFFELVVKVVAYGFAMHPGAYISSWWNVLDLSLVIVSLPNIFLRTDWTPGTQPSHDLEILSICRLLRTLRPLRTVQRLEGLQVVVETIIKCIPAVGIVMLFGFFQVFVFAIIGVQLFGGKFYYCNDSSIKHRDDCFGMYQPLPDQPYLLQRIWHNPTYNFDSVPNAMLTLSVVTGCNKWTEIMWAAMDTGAVDEQPVTDQNAFTAIYFILFIALSSFMWVNILVSVVVDFYHRCDQEVKQRKQTSIAKETLQKTKSISMGQFSQFNKVKVNQAWANPATMNPVRRRLVWLVKHEHLETFINTCIVLNTIVMIMYYPDQPQAMNNLQDNINVVLTSIYIIEAVLKLYALTPQVYFADKLNTFDFIITFVSAVFEIILVFTEKSQLISPKIIGMLRLGRLTKLVRNFRGLRALIRTLAISVPTVGNVLALIALLLFIFGVLAMNLFGHLKPGDTPYVNEHYNYRTMRKSCLTLTTVFTGTAFYDQLETTYRGRCTSPISCYDASQGSLLLEEEHMLLCSDLDLESKELSSPTDVSCDFNSASPSFFLMFNMIMGNVVINILTAALLDEFEKNAAQEGFIGLALLHSVLLKRMVMARFSTRLSTIARDPDTAKRRLEVSAQAGKAQVLSSVENVKPQEPDLGNILAVEARKSGSEHDAVSHPFVPPHSLSEQCEEPLSEDPSTILS